MDSYGQLSLEYLLLFFISLIILSTISIPLLNISIDDTMDVTKSVETKEALTEISKNVKLLYSLDDDSKKTVSIYIPANFTLYSTNSSGRYYLYTTLNLSDSSDKTVKVEVPCKVSFNGNANHYYSSLKNRWYYNAEFKWITSSNGQRSVNINFK